MKTLFVVLTSLVFGFSASAEIGATADVTLNPMGSFKAKTTKVTGAAVVNGDSVHAENISFSLKDLTTGIALRDKHAKEKYLETEKYPDAVLVKGEGKGGKGTGTLKIRGIEKPVSGTYKIEGDTVVASFPVKLSDYGIEDISYKGIGVEDTVNVNVTVPATKGAAAPAKKAAPKK